MCWWGWVKASEPIALWVEGLALVAIFIWDRIDRSHERKENLAQLAVAKKQVHADRVAAIYEAMRKFLYVVADGIKNDDFGPGRRFEHYNEDHSIYPREPYPIKEYVAIREAQYLSILIDENLAAYVKARVDEATALQGVDDTAEFNRRLDVFYKNWRGDVMANKLRELS
jgi:hypothetical protein